MLVTKRINAHTQAHAIVLAQPVHTYTLTRCTATYPHVDIGCWLVAIVADADVADKPLAQVDVAARMGPAYTHSQMVLFDVSCFRSHFFPKLVKDNNITCTTACSAANLICGPAYRRAVQHQHTPKRLRQQEHFRHGYGVAVLEIRFCGCQRLG